MTGGHAMQDVDSPVDRAQTFAAGAEPRVAAQEDHILRLRRGRLTRPCIALVVLLLAGSNVDATTIRGVPSCAYWLQDREPGGGSSYFNAMWLVGYLSGAAVHSEKDVLRTIDSESIALWMDNYCKANSSKNIAEGGEVLFDAIVRQAPADKTRAASTAPTPSTPNPPLAEPPPPAMPLSSLVTMTAKEPAEPGMPQSVESPAAAVNASTYLPRALMLVNTLPLNNSKYQFKAEQFAKANGCVRPAATMNIRTATSETFAVTCADGAALSIRCDPDCRDLQ